MFSLAALTRRAVVSYFGAVLLACVSAFSWTVVAGTWRQWELAKVLDPFGAAILGELSMVWTPAERSTRSIELQGAVLWNRVLWLTIAAGVLAVTYRRFRFRHHAGRPAWRTRSHPGAPAAREADTRAGRPTAPAPGSFEFPTHARQMFEVARESFFAMVRGWGGVVLVSAAAFLVFSGTPTGHMGVPMFPTAERMVRFLAVPLARPDEFNGIVVPLLIVFWAGELIWRDREARLNHITDAVPVPDWVLFLGKAAGLSVVLIVLQALVMAGGIVTQLRLRLLRYSDRTVPANTLWTAARRLSPLRAVGARHSRVGESEVRRASRWTARVCLHGLCVRAWHRAQPARLRV